MAPHRADQARILIVDDQSANVLVLEQILQREGDRQLRSVTDSREALAAFAEFQPDLILLDLTMPHLDGFAVMEQLRAIIPADAYLPILVLTADVTPEAKQRALAGGATDFLTKPFDVVEVVLRIRNLLETRRLHLRLAQQNQALEERVHERTTQLSESESKYRRLVENVQDIIYAGSLGEDPLASPFTYMSRQAESLLGAPPEAFIENPGLWSAHIHPEDAPRVRADTVEAFEKGLSCRHIYRFRHFRTGDYCWLEDDFLPLRGEDGCISGYFGVARDITQRKQMETEIERKLRQLAALHNIDTIITASTDRGLTLDLILRQIVSELGVDAACILLLNTPAQALEFAAGQGFRGEVIKRTRLRLGEGLAGRAALERRTIAMPHLSDASGIARAQLIASEDFKAYYAVPLTAKGQVRGVLEVFHRAQRAPDDAWQSFLETLAGQTAIAIDNARLFEGLQRSNVELLLAYETTLEGWSRALDLRDRETEGHTRRVTEMALRLARALGMNEAELEHVRRGALLHDIGKMGVPDAILLKPDALSDEEWRVMRLHPKLAYDLLWPIEYLRPALDIPYCHHEKWDGTGYPRGLTGEQIPLAARIFAVVDVWDALLADRPYRAGWPEAKVLAHIETGAGTHFDPKIAQAFLRLLGETA